MNFIYIITNLINGKQYVGSHCGDENDTYLGSGKIFLKAYKKYGKENFKREIFFYERDTQQRITELEAAIKK